MKRTRENGITLIALVVTIVVLLILAAVSIAMLTGENGIIKRASEAKEETEIGKEKEEVRLAYAAAKANKENYNDLVSDEEMNIELDNLNSTGTAIGTTIITVTFESGREYTINQETGEIEEGLTSDELKEIIEQADGDCFIDRHGNVFSTDKYDSIVTDENSFSLVGHITWDDWTYEHSYDSSYNGEIVNGKLKFEVPVYLKQAGKIYKLTEIGEAAFCGLSELTSIEIPENVTNIGDYAFYECFYLNSITIPDSVSNIGDYAFYYCRDLKSMTLPKSLTNIGYRAFYNCESLTSITIPENVIDIDYYAFSRCDNLTSITINKPKDSIEDAKWGADNATITWTDGITE